MAGDSNPFDEEEVVNPFADLPPVPPVDVSLEPHHKTMPVGVISSILGNRVIVEGSETHNPLNEGSPIHEKMEKVTLVEDEDGGGGNGGEKTTESNNFTLPEELDPTKFVNEDNIDDGDDEEEEESSEDSSSEESEESSSDESSSSSSSSSDDDKEEDKEKGDVVAADIEEGEIEREMFMDSDDEEVVVTKGPIKSKHEVEDLPPVPPVDVSLEPHHKTMPVGVISSILGNRVIVEGSETHNPLNEGSIIWITETRLPLGAIDEIFGPVRNPYYVIRFNSEEEFPKGITVGAAVSFTSEFAEHILNLKDLYEKGYDASADHDEEAEDEVEFSDDEKEAEHRRSLRQHQKRGTNHVNHDSGFGKKTNVKGAGFRKNKQSPPTSLPPLAAAACQQLGNQAGQVQAQATNIRRTANPRPDVGPPTMTMQTQAQALQMGGGNGIGNQSQQLNAVWPQGFPPRLQSMGIQEGAFPTNSLPAQQFVQQSYAPQYQQQFQFNQALNMFASGLMPYLQQQQQQFLPNVGALQGNMPWFGGLGNPLAGGQPPSPVVTMREGGFGMMPSFSEQQQQFLPNVGVLQGNMPHFGGPRNPLAGGPPSPAVTMGQGGLGMMPFRCSNEGSPASFSEQQQQQQQQQQFLPNVGAPQGNMPRLGGPQNPLTGGPPSPVVTMGQGGFGMMPFGCSNEGSPVSFSEQGHGHAISHQGEVRPPSVHSNRGRTSFRGRRPYHRGRHCHGGRG